MNGIPEERTPLEAAALKAGHYQQQVADLRAFIEDVRDTTDCVRTRARCSWVLAADSEDA